MSKSISRNSAATNTGEPQSFSNRGNERVNLLVLLGQAPLIALLTYLVINEEAPRDFPYFMLALVASWFGTSIAAREIIRARPIYKR